MPFLLKKKILITIQLEGRQHGHANYPAIAGRGSGLGSISPNIFIQHKAKLASRVER